MAPHSSTLAWKIPWMEEPGRLQSMGLRRVRQDWVTLLSLFTFTHWRRKWQPTPVPGEAQGQQSLVGCHLWGRTQSRTRLKRLSSSSSSEYSKNHSLSLIQFSDSIPLLLNEYQIHTRHSLDLSLGPTPVLQLDAYAIGCIYASGSFPHVPKLYLRSKAEDN